MSDPRPQVPTRPCPTCNAPVDPLRAGAVLLLEDGFRYFCNTRCQKRFRNQLQKGALAARLRSAKDTSGVLRRPERLQPPLEEVAATPGPEAPTHPQRHRVSAKPYIAGYALVSVSLLTAACSGRWQGLALVSALFAVLAAASCLLQPRPKGSEEWFAWGLGTAGTLFAASAVVVASRGSGPTLAELLGASLAACAVLTRLWLGRRSAASLTERAEALLAPLPPSVRVPVTSATNPMQVSFQRVPTERVRTGEEVLALAGEAVAVDGVVRGGEASVRLFPRSTEAHTRTPGDPVLAGARIEDGAIRLLATRVGPERGIARPASFGDVADIDRSPIMLVGAQVARWGLLFAGTALLGALVLTSAAGATGRLTAVAAVLVATPWLTLQYAYSQSWMAAAVAAARRGIVFQSPRSMDQAGRVGCAAFCTRGTITEGTPEVLDIHTMDESNEEQILAVAAGAEAAAGDHPISQAMVRFAHRRGVTPESVRRATHVRGRGVTALGPAGEPVVIGNRQLLLEEGISVAVAEAIAAAHEARGHTAIFAAIGGKVQAVFALRDAVRPSSRAAVQQLFDMDIEPVLLSGDYRPTLEAMASDLDIANIKAQATPDEKGIEVSRLRDSGCVVSTIGHPARDSEALAASDVPIMLGAAGSETAPQAIALATDDVRDASMALWIARSTRRVSGRATIATVTTAGLAIAGAATGFVGPAVAALAAMAVDWYALGAAERLVSSIEQSETPA